MDIYNIFSEEHVNNSKKILKDTFLIDIDKLDLSLFFGETKEENVNLMYNIHKYCIEILGEYNVYLHDFFKILQEKEFNDTWDVISNYLFYNMIDMIYLFDDINTKNLNKEINYKTAIKKYRRFLGEISSKKGLNEEESFEYDELEEKKQKNKENTLRNKIKRIEPNDNGNLCYIFRNMNNKSKKNIYENTSNIYLHFIDNYRNYYYESSYESYKKCILGFINNSNIGFKDIYYWNEIENFGISLYFCELYYFEYKYHNEKNEYQIDSIIDRFVKLAYLPNANLTSIRLIEELHNIYHNYYVGREIVFEKALNDLVVVLIFYMIPLYNNAFIAILDKYSKDKKTRDSYIKQYSPKYKNKRKEEIIKTYNDIFENYLSNNNIYKKFNIINKKINKIYEAKNKYKIKEIDVINFIGAFKNIELFIDDNNSKKYKKIIKKFIIDVLLINNE